MGAGIQPGEAPPEQFDVEVTTFQVSLVDAGYLQLAPCRRLHDFGDLHYIVVVEVQAGDRIVGFGLEGFFFDGYGSLVGIELDHTEALRILDLVPEHRGALLALDGLAQHGAEALSVEDVVAQHQADRVAADELFADDEGLSQAIRAGLYGIVQADAELATIAEKSLERADIVRRADQQDFADAGEHQYRQRVIDHRLIVDGQQLLGYAPGNGVQPGTGAAGEDDAFHEVPSLCNGAEAFSLVATVLYAAAPLRVVQIPLDGLADTGLEGFLGSPAQFALDLAGIDGVAQVVAGAVLDVGDQAAV
ncbi:hypothetical protein D3C78_1099590 [compost metagenome]